MESTVESTGYQAGGLERPWGGIMLGKWAVVGYSQSFHHVYHTSSGTSEGWSGDFNSTAAHERPLRRKVFTEQPLALRYRLGIVSLVTALDSASNHDDKHIQSTNQSNEPTRFGACSA